METCMMKPEIKQKRKPPKLPPKPTESNDGKLSGTPVVPPRPTEKELQNSTRYSLHKRTQADHTESPREDDPSGTGADETDFKQSNHLVLTGMFRGSQKEKKASFTSYLHPPNEQDSTDDQIPVKQAPSNKPEFLKGVMKGLNRKKTLQKIIKENNDSEDAAEDETSAQTSEKRGFLSNILKKSKTPADEASMQDNLSVHSELSASSDSLSEQSKGKGEKLPKIFKRSPKDEQPLAGDLSGSSDSLVETHSKFQDKESLEDSGSNSDSQSDNSNSKRKGNIFSEIFRKSPNPSESPSLEESSESSHGEPPVSSDNLLEKKEKGAWFGFFKKTPKGTAEEKMDGDEDISISSTDPSEDSCTQKKTASDELTGSREGLTDSSTEDRNLEAGSEDQSESNRSKEKKVFSSMFRKQQKAADGAAAETEKKRGGFAGKFKTSLENLFEKESDPAADDKWLTGSCENLSDVTTTEEKSGKLTSLFKQSPKLALRSVTAEHPLSGSPLSASWDSLSEIWKEDLSGQTEPADDNDVLLEGASRTKEKRGGLSAIFKRTPKTSETLGDEGRETPEGGRLRRKRTVKKKRRVVSFRIKRTLPTDGKSTLQRTDEMLIIDEAVEMQEINPEQESTVELQPVEMAAYPSGESPSELEEENDELMEWWNTVKGWTEWNKSSNFQEDEETAVEQAADRVYMAARLFVRLFNQRGASLQHRILELLAVADAADQFHKRTVTAAVGGGVASVAGSIATITGLILAPFTFGASVIVTAVGIGVATAGSITSATANITDTVHSNMDRKKVEKMIQGYQEEITVIRECLEFLQEGMDTLQEWDFEKYSESAAKKALNHNIKHVMKEGGRAGKALMINTDKLISTVQVLGAAGGAAKAAQAISVTTGVMSALFLALDVFFLAKDSHELRKGARTKFASTIREVCKDLQDGLLELNKVKTQLQKTMDGIELEQYEETEEVEVEEEDELESDPKKLAELEKDLDLMEEKLCKKEDEGEQSGKELFKFTKEKKEKSKKEIGEPDESKEKGEKEITKINKEKKEGGDGKAESKPEKEGQTKSTQRPAEEALAEESQKGSKKDKETKNRLTAGKEETPLRESDRVPKDSKKSTNGREKKRSPQTEATEAPSGSGDWKQHSTGSKALMESNKSPKGGSSREEGRTPERRGNQENRERDQERRRSPRGSDSTEEERRRSDQKADGTRSRGKKNKDDERRDHGETECRKDSLRGWEETRSSERESRRSNKNRLHEREEEGGSRVERRPSERADHALMEKDKKGEGGERGRRGHGERGSHATSRDLWKDGLNI
uniref:Si:rp71-1g18.13 n=1 Tax=Oryzias latipes TaxID=8090 RepID=A0A3P9J5N8_ORYLA